MINYYDTLFGSEEGTLQYYEFVKKHVVGKSILEFASGTGDLLALLTNDYVIKGVDLSENMIASAINKYPQLENKLACGDFLSYKADEAIDTLICFGDSLNYLLDETSLQSFIDNAASHSDHILLDCHHPYRLKEFSDRYYEEGSTATFDYAYEINVDGEHLVHIINFLDGTFDAVYQWVFDPQLIILGFEAKGYSVTCYTDFDQPGISETGEKIMFVISRGAK